MSRQPLTHPRGGSRHRIEEIGLNPATSTYPITAKVLVDSEMAFRLPKIAPGQPLRWHDIPPCDAVLATRISVRLYEQHTLSRPCIGSVEYIVSDVGDQREMTLACDTGKFTIKLEFAASEPDQDVATRALDKAQKTDRQRRLLERLGPTRNAIKAILDLGSLVAELHPAAKLALGICNQAWAKLEAQEQCDASVESLIDGLASILPYVEVVKRAAKLPQLQKTVTTLIHLIEDASRFIIEYKLDGGAVQTLKVLVGSTAQEQVDSLVKKLGALTGEFDRGVSVQVLQTVDMSAHRMLLNDLKPVGQAKYDPARACMPGTRGELIKEVLDWCKRPSSPDLSATTERLLWVHGHAGLGKSAIATSVCQALNDKKVLAASFFCKRDDPERRDPQRALTSLIHGLAVRCPSYGNSVAKALEEDISLCSSPIQTQYDKLVRDVLGSPTLAHSSACLVIVVDALDECGDQSTRQRLLAYLLRMSQLVTWLRIVVTSRPDKDIEEAFDRADAAAFSARDVYQYNASNDIRAFIRARLAEFKNARLLPDDTGDQLTERADGLFIWAQTACQFVLSSHNPRERLRVILAANSRPSQSTSALDSLYATTIKASIGDGGEDNAILVQQCLGAIVVCSTRMPLSVITLSALLGERAELDVLRSVLDSLGSVLYTDHSQGDTVRVYHPSFADYMTTPTRSGVYCVNLQEQDTVLAASCMRTMKEELRFNICGLETSYLRNRDLPNLAARVEASISRQLQYSCLYWTSHLVQAEKGLETTPDGSLLEELVTGPAMLYWIEAVSLLNKLHTWLASVQRLKDWCEGTKLYDYVKDADRFVQTFYDPIAESTPHLYISGLAFLPVNSKLMRLRDKFFSRTINITQGRERTWPSSLRCISHENAVHCVAVSPDCRRIISGSGDNLRIWDADTGVAIGDALIGHSEPVATVVFSPDGQLIASGSYYSTVRVWDVETGTPVGGPLTGHSSAVWSIAFSPDGHRLISASGDGIRMWGIKEGVLLAHSSTGQSRGPDSVVFSSDGRHVISAFCTGALEIWDANLATRIGDPLVLFSERVYRIKLSPDGRRAVSASYNKLVQIWDVATGTAVGCSLTGHTDIIFSATFSPDGHFVVSGSEDKTVRLWDSNTGTAAGNPLIGHSRGVRSVAFFPDGRRVVSGSLDKTVRVWDIDTIAAPGTWPYGHTDYVNSVAFSPSGRYIVSGSSDRTVRIWDADTGASIGNPLVGHSGGVICVAFSPDSQRIASGSVDRTVRIWDTGTGAAVLGPMVHSGAVFSLAFSPDGYRIVSGGFDSTARLWDAHTGVPINNPLVGHEGAICSVAFSSDGRLIASGSHDATARVWDASTGAIVGAPLVGHSGAVNCVAFSPDGHRLASGSEDGTIRVWDVITGAPVRDPFVGHSSDITSIAFSPDNSRIISGSLDNSMRMWDAYTGAAVGDSLVGHLNYPLSVAFSPDGRRIASGSTDHTVRVWDADAVSTVRQSPLDSATESSNLTAALSQLSSVALSWLAHNHCTPSGWILSNQNELLFWVPPEYPLSERDDSLFVISSDSVRHSVQLDLSKFVHGTEWANVFAPSEDL